MASFLLICLDCCPFEAKMLDTALRCYSWNSFLLFHFFLDFAVLSRIISLARWACRVYKLPCMWVLPAIPRILWLVFTQGLLLESVLASRHLFALNICECGSIVCVLYLFVESEVELFKDAICHS